MHLASNTVHAVCNKSILFYFFPQFAAMEPVDLSSGSSEATIQINRPVFTNEHFNKTFPPKAPENLTKTDYIKRKIQQKCQCGSDTAKRLVYYLLPAVEWIPKYKIKEYLLNDFVAGLTVGVVNIPQGMAFSLLASLAPVYGLYVSFFPVLIYFLMGTSRHISVGTFAVVSIMCSNAVQEILKTIKLPTDQPMTTEISSTLEWNDSNVDVVPTSQYLEAEKIKIHTALCLLVGIFQMLMGAFHLGFVTIYLSDCLIRAFTCGAACHVITSQVKYFFGLDIPAHHGYFAIIYTWIDIFKHLPDTNAAEFIIAIIAMAALVTCKIISTKWKDKIKFPIPTELIVVVIATLSSYYGKLPDKYGIDPVGHIPHGFPRPEVPAMKYFGSLIGDAFAISIVGFAVSVSLAKIFASKNNYEIHSNQELLAYGAANIFSSFFSCFVSAASLARSVLQDGVGGRTQMASVVSCTMVLIVVLWLGMLLEPLPKVILAVIIVFALMDMIMQIRELKTLWGQSKYDWMIWLVTLLAVVLLGVDIGLFVGIGFAFLTVVLRTQLSEYVINGNMAGTEIYKNQDVYPNTECPCGIKIFQMQSPLYFANVQQFCNQLYKMVGVNPHTVLQDVSEEHQIGLRKRKRRKEDNKEDGIQDNTTSYQVEFPDDQYILDDNFTSITNGEQPSSTIAVSSDQQLEAIVIDCSAFNFIDLMAVKTLLSVVNDYDKIGVRVVLAQCKDSVQGVLRNGGFFTQISQDILYLTVHDAVVGLSTNSNYNVYSNGETTVHVDNSQNIQNTAAAESKM
ncbi:sulfate transporter-like [Amphiura filiformis]|uniref:sulfate transporter-like n=1 Tax=Amphiura filiformis TaxID=82378 RepID=UPI003B21F2A9